ncbi:MAG: serine hydrolase [Sphingomonadaceae bacterium]|nr:serine hydrolase [Sphingomonadaceae bacterium]
MPAHRLTLTLLALTAPLSAQDDIATVTAERMKAFPAAQAVENAEAYQPAEEVKGSPRRLALAKESRIDAAALTNAQDYADRQKSFAFLVLQDGKLVHERYAAGFNSTNRFSPASMHKTVMALAIGAARLDIDKPVSKWLTEWKDDPRGAITLRQLLTMSSGLETPPFSPDPKGLSTQLFFGPDIAKTALNYKLVAAPGSVFSYSNGNSQLAGLILERATGQRYADFLSAKIWKPIGGDNASVWLDRPGGMAHSFCCLQATARDWARIGQLILDEGKVRGRQVVPKEWVAEMVKPAATNANYGLQLWLGSPYVAERKYSSSSALVAKAAKPFARDGVLFLDGAVGQRVYIVPSEKLVIVRIGQSSMSWDDSELPNRVLAGLR